MLGINQKQKVIDDSDTNSRDITMNKLIEGNQPVLHDAGVVALVLDHNGRIGRFKEGDCYDNVCEEDDAKSLTLESLKDKTKLGLEHHSDRDFVSQSSLTIVSESNLFQENSRWWSMINHSESNINAMNTYLDASSTAIIPNISNSNDGVNNNTGNTNSKNEKNSNTPFTDSSNTKNTNTNRTVNNHDNMNNHFHRGRNAHQNLRRSSILSEITFGSEDDDEDDEETTLSGDSSWGQNSALLTTAKRFAPNHYSNGSVATNNETIEEEQEDYREKLKSRSNSASAPTIPRRRISKICRPLVHKNVGFDPKTTSATARTKEGGPAHALRSMAKGDAIAPRIPKRTSSINSTNLKNNSSLYLTYSASMASIVSSQISQDTDPSFVDDGSAAAAAAAAYLSTAAKASQQEEVRTVQSVITSDTAETTLLKNHRIKGRRLSRDEGPIESEIPPMLPERQNSHKQLLIASYKTHSSFEEDSDVHPPIVLEEESFEDSDSMDSDSKRSNHRLPNVPRRKRSTSEKNASFSSRSSGNTKPLPRKTQLLPLTIPMHNESNHTHAKAQESPISKQSPLIHSNRNAALNRMRLSPHKSEGQATMSQKHRPPTKPTRTNSTRIVAHLSSS